MRQFSKITFLVSAAMCFFLFTGLSMAVETPSDIGNHWAKETIKTWLNAGLISGYPDGTFRPNDNITRAEFIAMVNRIYGFSESGDDHYQDVDPGTWYWTQTAIAKNSRYMDWYQNANFEPNQKLTREDASVILSTLLLEKSQNAKSTLDTFSDSDQIPVRYSDQVAALVERGFLRGYPDGTFKPQGFITRAEVVALLDQVVGERIEKSGTIGGEDRLETIDGNVTLLNGNVRLQNLDIEGDLVFAAGIAPGETYIDHVVVKGKIIIDGDGGTIHLVNSDADAVYCLKRTGQSHLYSDRSRMNQVNVQSDLILEGDFESSHVIFETPGKTAKFDGRFGTLDVDAVSNISLLENATVRELIIAPQAADTLVKTENGSRIVQTELGRLETNPFVAAGDVKAEDAASDHDSQHKSEDKAPGQYSISIDQAVINNQNQKEMSFTFNSANRNVIYEFAIDDTNEDTKAVVGTGITETSHDQIRGINVSRLDDDTLTLTVSLTDTSGNKGPVEVATIEKETLAPSDYSVAINTKVIAQSNEGAFSFSFSDAEIGTTYYYAITDPHGNSIFGSGAVEMREDQIEDIDVKTLSDGGITLNFTLEDAAGNIGETAQDTVEKDATAPAGYRVKFEPSSITSANILSASFTVEGAEVGAVYYYKIDDGNDNMPPVRGKGTIHSEEETFENINVSRLEDGTLTLFFHLIDDFDNRGAEVTDTIIKTY